MQTRMSKRDHNFPILNLKSLSSHSVLASYCPNRALQSQTAGLLVFLKIHKSRLGGRPFSYQTSLIWNHLPVQIWGIKIDILSIFKIRLKTFNLIKIMVKTRSGNPKPSLSYTARGLNSFGNSCDTLRYTYFQLSPSTHLFSLSTCLYATSVCQ